MTGEEVVRNSKSEGCWEQGQVTLKPNRTCFEGSRPELTIRLHNSVSGISVRRCAMHRETFRSGYLKQEGTKRGEYLGDISKNRRRAVCFSAMAMATEDRDKETESGDLIVCHRYRLVRRIGSGTFGTVFLGIDLLDDREVAMKLETRAKSSGRLWHEFHIYKNLTKEVGFPEVFWFGSQGDFNIMVMELLGPSLEDLFNFCSRLFSLKTVLLLADQLLSRLQALHLMGIIHRDVKPDNFVMGLGSKQKIAHVWPQI
uniref:non-specific serine/threonine protein kinase n=1 Tax=Setaria digitata TaxID=48799 RepID=A0A915PNG8_9BILA